MNYSSILFKKLYKITCMILIFSLLIGNTPSAFLLSAQADSSSEEYVTIALYVHYGTEATYDQILQYGESPQDSSMYFPNTANKVEMQIKTPVSSPGTPGYYAGNNFETWVGEGLISQYLTSEVKAINTFGEFAAKITASGGTPPADVASYAQIKWYVIKDQSDGYHLDGVLILPDVQLYYDSNPITGNSETRLDSETDNQLGHMGLGVTVDANAFTAPAGKYFAGWNTAKDGSGTDYTVNSTYTLGNENVTLYAQWDNIDLGLSASPIDEFYSGAAQELVTGASTVIPGTTIEYSMTGNDGDWSTDIPTATNYGEYTVYVRATKQDHVTVETEVVSNIRKRTVLLTANDYERDFLGIEALDFNGAVYSSMQDASGSEIEGTGFVPGESFGYTVTKQRSYPDGTPIDYLHAGTRVDVLIPEVGTPAEGTSADNYTFVLENGNYTIGTIDDNRTLSMQGVEKVYDAVEASPTLSTVEPVPGDRIQYSYRMQQELADGTPATQADGTPIWGEWTAPQISMPKFDDAGVYEVSATLINTNLTNLPNPAIATVTINQRPVTITNVKYVRDFEPNFVEGSEVYTEAKVQIANGKNTKGMVAGEAFTISVGKANDAAGNPIETINAGKYYDAVTSTVTDGTAIVSNYKINIVPANYIIKDADFGDRTIEMSSETQVYNNEELSATLTNLTPAAGDVITYSYKEVGGTWSAPQGDMPEFTEAGKYKVKAVLTNPNYEGSLKDIGEVNITKRPVTITTSSYTRGYDLNFVAGTEVYDPATVQAENKKDTKGLVAEESFSISVNKVNDANGNPIETINAGTYANALISSVSDGDPATVEAGKTPADVSNYNVKVILADYIITPESFEEDRDLQLNGIDETYDSNIYNVELLGGLNDDTYQHRVDGGAWINGLPTAYVNATDATVEVRVENNNFVDAEGNNFVILNADVDIAQVPITITAADFTRAATGIDLLNFAGATITAGSMVGTETFNFIVNRLGADQTVGTYLNDLVPSVTENGTALLANYDITYVNGDYTITPVAVPAPPTPIPPVPVTLTETDIPTGDGPTTIEDDEVPTASGLGGASWSLFNAIATIVGVAVGLLIAAKKRKEDEDDYDEEEDERAKRAVKVGMIAVALFFVLNTVMFFLTQDLTTPMAIFDKWSIFFGVSAVAQMLFPTVQKLMKKNEQQVDAQ